LPPSPSLLLLLFPRAPAPDVSALSLHDALPISGWRGSAPAVGRDRALGGWPETLLGRCSRRPRSAASRITCRTPQDRVPRVSGRSEEHTSELQSRRDLVCRLLLEKKKNPASPTG